MEKTVQRDLAHLWHPCSQMKDYENFPPVPISGATGSYLYQSSGRRIIDAVSSWWCKSLGHGHPRLRSALIRQAEKMEHVISANARTEVLDELSKQLCSTIGPLSKVFFAGDGSMAIEIAMKMSLQAQKIRGNKKRIRFAALENSYHGESLGALALSAPGIYRDAYAQLMPEVEFLNPVPYRMGKGPWDGPTDEWGSMEAQLEILEKNLAAVIVEPLLQGASGMKMYSSSLLPRLREWTEKRGIYLIADEILTGFGRTGKFWAVEHAGVIPDFLCTSKGLTGGWLPMSAVLLTEDIYSLFYDDYEKGKNFFHSNTYSGNALAAAVALETLQVYREENIIEKSGLISNYMWQAFQEVAQATGRMTRVRGLGTVVAADLIPDVGSPKRLGYKIFQEAVRLGAWLRPLGNTLYWLLPLNCEKHTIEELKGITEKAIIHVYENQRGT